MNTPSSFRASLVITLSKAFIPFLAAIFEGGGVEEDLELAVFLAPVHPAKASVEARMTLKNIVRFFMYLG